MSLIYKLDPRIKLLIIILFTVLVLFINKLQAAVGLLFLFIVIRMAAKVPFRGIKHIRNLSLLAAFIVLMQAVFGPGDNFIAAPLFPPSFPVFGGTGSIKWEGFILGLVIVCRLGALLVIFPVFTETTSTGSLAAGLNALGLNYRTAFVITMAFNLIPHFREEALVIMDAQKLRGMQSFDKGSLLSKLKAYSSLAVPLILGAMRKAQSSSIAMDSRAFGIYRTRTWLEKPKMKLYDFLSLAFCIVFFAVILFVNHLF